MKEKKKSAVSWILIWAGQKRIAYVWSVLLAIGNVVFKIFPYFIIADVVKLLSLIHIFVQEAPQFDDITMVALTYYGETGEH